MKARARSAARLTGQLKGAALERHGVVTRDEALLLVTQDLLEVDTPERHEGARRIRGGAAEGRVVVRNKAIPQVGIGGRERRDLGDAELVHQAILERAIESLAATARLGRVRGDVLDAESLQRASDLSELAAIDRSLACGVLNAQCARSV